MIEETPDWLATGQGARPRAVWTFATEAPLVTLRLARETGEVLAADTAGGLYLLNQAGRLLAVARGPSPIRALAWGDTGSGGVALVGDDVLYWFDRELRFEQKLILSERALGLTCDAHGQYVAVSLIDSSVLIFDSPRRPLATFDTTQPLVLLEFLVEEPALVGAASYGLLCKTGFDGTPHWSERVLTNVGAMTITGDGEATLLACFNQGIQRHDEDGDNVGSYQVDGTVSLVSASYTPRRLAAATQERRLFWIDFDGRLLWTGQLPDEPRALATDPLGEGTILGLQSGRICRLSWD